MSARPSPFDNLKPLAGRALESALNRVLALDPETQSALARLEGRRIELALDAPVLALSITVSERRLRVGPPLNTGEPDLGIRASLSAALSQLPFLRAAGAPPVGKLRINGDAELARSLQKLAQGFDPDWGRPFDENFGPVLGPQIERVLRGALRQGLASAKGLARDAADYLTEESRDVLGRAELAAFHDDVDELRDRAERLVARVEALRSRHGGGA